MFMASDTSAEGSLDDGSTVSAPEGSGAASMAFAWFLKLMDGLVRSRAKTFGGTVVCPDAIFKDEEDVFVLPRGHVRRGPSEDEEDVLH